MKHKLRIAFIDYVLEPDKPGRSGLSDFVWDMASELVRQGHKVHIIASYHTDQYPDPDVKVHNFPTPPIGYRNIIGQIWIIKRAADIIRQLQPDIVHAPEYVSTAVMSTLGIKTPLVLTVPGNIFQRIEKGHGYEWYYVQVLKWAARTSAQRCARVIAVSYEMKNWWEWTGSKPEHTPMIPTGIDPLRFSPVQDARKRLGIAEDVTLLLYVGRFSPEKGLLDLLTAVESSREQLRDCGLRIRLIGKGSQEKELYERIANAKLSQLVHIQSWVPQHELSSWYSAADALLLPSYSEGFSRTIAEAMACGTPVIGTRITGTEDHIIDGMNGFLFEPHDAHKLSSILERIAIHPNILCNMRSACIEYVQKNLLWSRVIERIIEEVYTPLLIGKPVNSAKSTKPIQAIEGEQHIS